MVVLHASNVSGLLNFTDLGHHTGYIFVLTAMQKYIKYSEYIMIKEKKEKICNYLNIHSNMNTQQNIAVTYYPEILLLIC